MTYRTIKYFLSRVNALINATDLFMLYVRVAASERLHASSTRFDHCRTCCQAILL